MTAPFYSPMFSSGAPQNDEPLSCIWVDNRTTSLDTFCQGFGLSKSAFCLAKDQSGWLSMINGASIGLLVSHLPIQSHALSQHLENVTRLQPYCRIFLLQGRLQREPFLRELTEHGGYFWRNLSDVDDYVGAYHLLNARAQFI